MKVLMITRGKLPLPNIKGGAVEYLIQLLIDENEKVWHEDFTVCSLYCEGIEKEQEKYQYCNFMNINGSSIIAKLSTGIRYLVNRYVTYIGNEYISRVFKMLGDSIHSYDVIIDENGPDFLPLLRKKYKGRLVFHAHNDWLEPSDHKKINCCDEYWAISNYLAEKISSDKIKAEVKVLYNGIRLEDYTQVNDTLVERYAKQFHIEPEDLVLVYAGRIVPEKGVYQMIQAFIQAEFQPHIKLLIVGGSFYSSGHMTNYMKKCYELAKSYSNIIFAGYVPSQEMSAVYHLGHIGFFPSLWAEAFGLSVLEMMAVGLPVITTNRGAIPEVVDAKCGVLLSPDNETQWIAEMAHAMKQLAGDENLRTAMGAEGKKRAENFTEENYLKKFINLLYREDEET